MGPQDAVIRKVGLCSGGGSDEWHSALLSGCDAFISGEIKHHHALDMADNRLVGLECGHFSTEEPGIRALASALQNALNTVECNVRIYVSEISAYSFPRQP
jgi:putative NIF3 family GTP cyclohydrolase 1 type 2